MAIIGKNVIENLTTAMYEDLRIIYREYIQNSADSIDRAVQSGLIHPEEARIEIEIDPNNRCVCCRDNGTGISSKDFERVMSSIADSTKDRTEDKGFRGIGRLGAISSCKTLRFSCSCKGESTKSICTWNAEYVRDVLNDATQNPSASELVDRSIRYDCEECGINEHFFLVEIIGVEASSSELLDVKSVKDYLSLVAPIPYATGFIFKSKIAAYAREHEFAIDEYQVFVNGERLFKPYSTYLYKAGSSNSQKKRYDEIVDIAFESFQDKKGNVLAWMWYGISKFENQIPAINRMRGIRLRKANIQIGDENTFSFHDFYKEPRGPLYFVGEVFAVSADLIPNARRDYFNLNDTCREFEDTLRPLFYDRFGWIYHKANEYKKATQKQAELQVSETEYAQQESEGAFIDPKEREETTKKLEELRETATKATARIESLDKKASEDNVMKRVYAAIRKDYQTSPADSIENTPSNPQDGRGKKQKAYLTQHLPYSKKEQKLISKIYNILRAILPHDTAKMVINKIQEELKNTGRTE